MVIRNDHNFRVDFQNSKAAITMISMALIILLSLGSNTWQFDRNSQFKDNDLKYRYIKSVNGINCGNLRKLEDIFQDNRDKKKIKEIQEMVDDYEHKINEVAQKLVHSRMNVSNPKN